ncbi:MAG: protein-glutamate O-methyltransferase CheR [Porticoccus sp.]
MASTALQRSHSMGTSAKGDFEFTDKDFRFIVKFIAEHAGIVMSDAKRDLVYGRIIRRLRACNLTKFSDYCKIIESGDSDELEHFVNALTTNLTSFFREQHHFDFLQEELLPALIKKKTSKVIRIWSAGCSTGEEPYSIAMAVSEVLPADWDVRILATDLDSNVVATAQQGIYNRDRVDGIPLSRLKRWFRLGKGAREGVVRVVPELREMISFRQLNLLSKWPMKGSFDIVFCRNVVIYFDKSTQQVLFDRFAQQIDSDAHLFIGHSETLYKVSDRFALLGNTIYNRIK